MKKTTFMCLFLAMACLVFPQNKKGNLFIGVDLAWGGLEFGNTEVSTSLYPYVNKSNYTSFSLGVDPTIGYYLTDNLVVGTYFELSFLSGKSNYSSTGYSDTAENTSHSLYLFLGPFGRFYFGNENGKGRPYVQADFGIGFYPI